MKQLFTGAVILLIGTICFSQTPQLNQEKYWKFRNDFRDKFLKIGKLEGESLPAKALKPGDCIDNNENNIEEYFGEMHWGDGMIRHGHYLILLATEYRLLKNNGQTEQANATLMELYYALWAFQRLDINAEVNQEQIHGDFNTDWGTDTYNGFYNREDIPENFIANWGNDPMQMRCTHSAFYTNNNSEKVDNGGKYVTKGNSYQNVPSQDQTSSLLIGLSMVMKLVDQGTIVTPPDSPSRDIYLLARDHMINIVMFAARNNWFLLDVHGWPVNNGGGDLILTATPVIKALNRWFPPVLLTSAKRQVLPYKGVQAYVTGYDVNGPYTEEMSAYDENLYGLIYQNPVICYPPAGGEHYQKPFPRWQNCGVEINLEGPALTNLWTNFIPGHLDNLNADWADNHRFDNVFGYPGTLFNELLSQIEFDENPIKDYNRTLLFNYGVASGWWNSAVANAWADDTGNRQLELVNCILNNFSPIENQTFYQSYLNELDFSGPYKLEAGYYNPVTEQITNKKNLFHDSGWGAEYRWTHPAESISTEGDEGIYSGLDYMVYYNLFHLLYSSQLPSYQESWTCNCTPDIVASGPINSPEDQVAYNNLNRKLSFVPTCHENVFSQTNNLVSALFPIDNKFSNYSGLGIYTNKYQTENSGVLSGGDVRVRTRFVICNSSTLNIQSGGRVSVERKEMIVNTGGIVDNTGELRLGAGTTFTLKSGSKLILRAGGVLIIGDNAKVIVEEGASIEYYNTAGIRTDGPGSTIILRGKIKTMNATTFKIDSFSSSGKGKLLIEGPNSGFDAAQTTVFYLSGNSPTDAFIEIGDNSQINVTNSSINIFRISNCIVKLGLNSYVSSTRYFQALNIKFQSNVVNGGVTVKNTNSFITCQFENVPLNGFFTLAGSTAKLEASSCNFINNGVNVNNGLYLVKVTNTGFVMGSCVFSSLTGSTHLLSTALTLPSVVTSSTFSQNASGTARTVTGLNDNSNIEVSARSCTFNQLATGIKKTYGKLTLKCNSFVNIKTNNLNITGGALNMTTSDLAGYNVLQPTTSGSSILLYQSTIALDNGYNFISDAGTGYTISGSLSTPCTPPGCITYVRQNQWNTGNTVAPASKFQLVNSPQSYTMLVVPSPVAVKPACGYYDGPPVGVPGGGTSGRPGNGEVGEKSTHDADGMPRIWFDPIDDSARLDDIVLYGISRTSSYDTVNGDDLEAIEVFDQVFNSDPDLSDSAAYYYSWLAFDHMKSALENSFYSGLISKSQNDTEFEDHVAMYANAMMTLSDSVIDEENYLTQFYLEFDKAHLFRVIGHPEIGLSILNELEYCGIDSIQQAQLNYWKVIFETDVYYESHLADTLADTIVADTLSYIDPVTAVNAYSFGAQIASLNEITYPNCGFYNNKALFAKPKHSSLRAFPNPASNEVTIVFPQDVTGTGSLVIQQSDGKNKLKLSVDLSKGDQQIDVRNWSPGIYTVSLLINRELFNVKLIVQ